MSGRAVTFVAAMMALMVHNSGNAQTATAQGANGGNPVAAVPLAALTATRERPLFSRTRRPASQPVIAPPARPTEIVAVVDEPAAQPFTLLGTIIGPGDRIAILMNDGTRAAIRLREGAADSGWTLLSVERRSAVLANDGRSVTLALPTTRTATNAPIGNIATEDALARARHEIRERAPAVVRGPGQWDRYEAKPKLSIQY